MSQPYENVDLGTVMTELLRTNFLAFAEKVFHTLNPGAEYVPGLHIVALGHALGEVEAGEVRRLSISMPPRSLKSVLVSVAWPAWILAHRPATKIISISYGQDLARSLSLATRRVMESDWYRQVFPNVLDRRRVTQDELRTQKNGFRLATSVGGTLTGLGADYIVLDDLLSADNAFSAAVRESTWDWLNTTLMSRLDDPRTGRIVVVSQRLHVDDIPGRLAAKGGWEQLSLPMVAANEPSIPLTDRIIWDREPGELLHPERLNQADVERLKAELRPEVWEAQYMQRPSPPGGFIFKLQDFKRYGPLKNPKTFFEAIVVSIDTGLSTATTADYTAATVWGLRGHDIYLLDAERGRLGFNQQIALAEGLGKKHQADRLIIEKAVGGHMVIEELRRRGNGNVLAYNPKDDKITRAHYATAKITAGKVHIPNFNPPWQEAFLNEVGLFPNGKNDDWVDSMTQLLRSLDYGLPIPGLSIYGKAQSKSYLLGG